MGFEDGSLRVRRSTSNWVKAGRWCDCTAGILKWVSGIWGLRLDVDFRVSFSRSRNGVNAWGYG